MHTAEKLTNKKPGLHLAFGATRQGPPATEMLRFGARIGSRHETPALSCPSTYSFVSAKSLIYMSQYFAKSPQLASEKIKPVRMLILGLLLVCSMTAALLASASHGELPPHLHVSVSAESSSRLSAKIKPSVILILGGCLHSPL